jgi:hypothetical protein
MKKHVLTFSILLLTGCSSGYRVPSIVDTTANYTGVHYGYDSVTKRFSPFSQATPHINPYTFNPTCQNSEKLLTDGCNSYYSDAMNTDPKVPIQERNLKRNALVEALLSISQEATSAHESSIQAAQTDFNTLLKLGVAGTTAAGTVAGVSSAAVLSAAASGSNAAQQVVSEEVYQKQLAGNINDLISQEREKKIIEIRNSLAKKDVYEYSVQRGITEALDYHESGSFYKALETINANLAKSVNDNKNFTDDARGKLNLDEEIQSEKAACDKTNAPKSLDCEKLKKLEAEKLAQEKIKLDAELAKIEVKKAQADADVEKAGISVVETKNPVSQTIGGNK